jgi:hypothetical protein
MGREKWLPGSQLIDMIGIDSEISLIDIAKLTKIEEVGEAESANAYV